MARGRPRKLIKETVLEVKKPEVVIETKPAEPRLICNYCGGELFLLREASNQKMYKCGKCGRGLSVM